QERPDEGAGGGGAAAGAEVVLLPLAARLASSRLLPARTDRAGRRPPGPGLLAALPRIHERAAARAAHELRRHRRHLVRRLVGQAGRRLAARQDVFADPPAPAASADRIESPSAS